jgi:hypothetical protein
MGDAIAVLVFAILFLVSLAYVAGCTRLNGAVRGEETR